MQKTIDTTTIKALALDLDGTLLLPDATLGKKTVRCLKTLASRGIHLVICTGRAVESSLRYCNELGATGPMVFFNGAEIVDIPSMNIVSTNLLDVAVVDYAVELARSMGLHFQVFLPPEHKTEAGRLLVERCGELPDVYKNRTGMQPVAVDMKAAIAVPGLQGCPKAMFITDASKHDAIRGAMRDRFGDRITIVSTSPIFLEIMNAGVSKGKALETALACRGVRPEQAIAFGDEENDLAMFAVAGFSVAPSNAKKSVLEAPDFVCPSNAEEGLATFLENVFGDLSGE